MSPSRQSPPHGRSPAWAGTLTAVVIGVVALVALTYAVQVFLQAGEHEMELRAAVAAAEPLQTAGLAAALLLGVVASYVYKRASAAPDDRLDIVRTLREMVRSGRFWMAFVVSPIVFNVVLVAVGWYIRNRVAESRLFEEAQAEADAPPAAPAIGISPPSKPATVRP